MIFWHVWGDAIENSRGTWHSDYKDCMSENGQDEVKKIEEKLDKVNLKEGDNSEGSGEPDAGSSILGFEKEDPFKEAGEDAAGINSYFYCFFLVCFCSSSQFFNANSL